MPFYSYGYALHGILTFLAQPEIKRFELSEVDLHHNFNRILNIHGHVMSGQINLMTTDDAHQMLEYWAYIVQLAQLCARVEYEPLMPNGTRPDMLCHHRGHLYLIEVKATLAHNGRIPLMKEGTRTAARRQIDENIMFLRREHGVSTPVHGYLLLFGVGHGTYHMQPRWLERT